MARVSFLKKYILLVAVIGLISESMGQDKHADTTVIAGKEYAKPRLHQLLWGKNCRAEWTTPVKVPVLLLDKIYGGLTPFKVGGGNETKTLQLKDPDGKQYTLRSINKSRAEVVEPIFKNTFVQDIINDGISMSYPYAAFALPVMEHSARSEER